MINHCSNKDADYYNWEKNRIAELISEGANKILDIGCASGRLGKKLRELNKAEELIGIEIYQPAAEEASLYYNKIFQDDIESFELPFEKYFDYVICGDILEHLRDPWKMVERIHGWLKPGGSLIASIPNIRYWQILTDLILFGKWEYVDAGILDNTHLRFFTRKSFNKLLQDANYDCYHEEMVIHGNKKNIANKITIGLFKEFLGSQVIVMAK